MPDGVSWRFRGRQRCMLDCIFFQHFWGGEEVGAEPVTPLNYGTVHFSAEKIPALANKASLQTSMMHDVGGTTT